MSLYFVPNWRRISFSLWFLFSLGCLPQESRQFGIQEWKAESLDSGEVVDFRNTSWKAFAVNIYGRNCPPCDKEIPTLNWIYNRLTGTPYGIVMAVDPLLILEQSLGGSNNKERTKKNLTDLTPKDWSLIRATLQRDKQEKNIQVPIYLMLSSSFRVGQQNFITGTPETILVQTNPWKIYYNFIGSLSEKNQPIEIEKDPKVLFFLSKLGVKTR